MTATLNDQAHRLVCQLGAELRSARALLAMAVTDPLARVELGQALQLAADQLDHAADLLAGPQGLDQQLAVVRAVVNTPPATIDALAQEMRSLARTTCDVCDRPAVGGAVGGGVPAERWCASHAPEAAR